MPVPNQQAPGRLYGDPRGHRLVFGLPLGPTIPATGAWGIGHESRLPSASFCGPFRVFRGISKAFVLLPDYLQPDLDVVFVGLNPSLRSAQIGHYYAGRGNQFWPFLYRAGFTDRLLEPEEDALCLEYNFGLTDFVKRATRGIGQVKGKEFKRGYEDVIRKIVDSQPGFVCFNGKAGYQQAVGDKRNYGLQRDSFDGIPLFIVPSTSGALPIKREAKFRYFAELKTQVDLWHSRTIGLK